MARRDVSPFRLTNRSLEYTREAGLKEAPSSIVSFPEPKKQKKVYNTTDSLSIDILVFSKTVHILLKMLGVMGRQRRGALPFSAPLAPLRELVARKLGRGQGNRSPTAALGLRPDTF
uniref:Uncharacterized protein n=1 Tax=Amphimedon queenslandica TaxID=400682 RepID=A0A1X7TGQ3_AMPQE